MKKKIKNVVEFVMSLLLTVFTVVYITSFIVSSKDGLAIIDIIKTYLIISMLIGLCFLFVDIVANRIKDEKKEIEKKIEKEYKQTSQEIIDGIISSYKDFVKFYDDVKNNSTKKTKEKEIATEFFKWHFYCKWYLTDNEKWIFTYSNDEKKTKNIYELFELFLTEYNKSKENEK